MQSKNIVFARPGIYEKNDYVACITYRANTNRLINGIRNFAFMYCVSTILQKGSHFYVSHGDLSAYGPKSNFVKRRHNTSHEAVHQMSPASYSRHIRYCMNQTIRNAYSKYYGEETTGSWIFLFGNV
jgi:hypothetical protein